MTRRSGRMGLLGILVVAGAALLSGCSMIPGVSDGASEEVINRSGIDIIASDAGRQFTYLKDQGTLERMCRGPDPDFSRTASGGISGIVPVLSGSAVGIGDSASKGSLDLGGRDAAVLITRELMYRACELAANTGADPATERTIYREFLGAIVEISKAHAGAGSAPLAAEPNMPIPVSSTPGGSTDRGPGGYSPPGRGTAPDNDKDGYEPPDPYKDR